MSKKITPNMLLLGLGSIGLIGLLIIGYTTFRETLGSTPTSTTHTKTAPLQASSVARSPNIKDKPVTGQIIIKFKPQYTDTQIAQHLKLYHATISRKIEGINQTVIKVPAGQEDTIVKKLQDDGFADEAVRDYTTHALDSPNDSGFVNQWALSNTGQIIEGTRGNANDDVRAEAAWGMSQGNGVKVAILDTGINLNHPDLIGKVVAQKVFITNSIEDYNGHGTHVAGIIAANTNNGIGIAGICPSCQLIIGKVMDDSGSGTTSDTTAGIAWAADQGAKVINLSLGTTDASTLPLYQEAINYATQQGAVVIAAAGNSNNTEKIYPAAVAGVISVAATDNANKKASFSTYGSWVQMAAPGTNILSTLPNHTNAKGALNYGYDSGTSMAGPIVAGIAALVAATPYGTTPQAITSRLYATADKISGTGTNWQNGLVDAASAVGVGDGSQPTFFCAGGSGAPPCATIPPHPENSIADVTATPIISPGVNISGTPTILPFLFNPKTATNTAAPALDNTAATPCSETTLSNNQDTSIQDASHKKKGKGYAQKQKGGGHYGGGGFVDSFLNFFLQIFNLFLRMVGTPAIPCTSTTIPAATPIPTDAYTNTPTPFYNYITATPTPIYGYITATPTPIYGYEPTPTPIYGYNPTPTLIYGYSPTATPAYGYQPTPTPVYGYVPTPTPDYNYPYPPTPTVYAQPTGLPTPPVGTVIFDDVLASGWSDASFDAIDTTVSSTVYSGTTAISSQINANGGFDLQSVTGQFAAVGTILQFSLKASQSNQQYEIYADTNYGKPLKDPVSLSSYGGQPNASGWKTYNVPLSALGATNVNLRDIVIHDATGSNQPVVYIDQIVFVSGGATVPTAIPTPTVIVPSQSAPSPTATISASPTGTSGTPTQGTTPTGTGSPTVAAGTPTQGITPTQGTTPTGVAATTNPTPTRVATPTTRPTATSTPRPTATSAPTPTPTPSILVRKSIYDMTPTEMTRLANALNTMRTNGSYQTFVNRHSQAMSTLTPANETGTFRNVAHRGPAFLPWHRALLWEFEQALRKIDPTVTLPYWPFEQDASTANAGQLPRVFTSAYFGSDGNRNQNNHVTDGPFSSWGVTRELGRDPQGLPTLPTQANINQIMQYTNYDSSPYDESSSGFRNALEGWIGVSGSVGGHNRVHEYIGGDMATTTNLNSANDPVFWLVHADIDRIWWEWQQSHGQTNYQPTSGGPVGHNMNDVMQLLPEGFRPSQTFSTQSMGYTYQ